MPEQFDVELMGIQHCGEKNEKKKTEKKLKIKKRWSSELIHFALNSVIKQRRFKIV